MDIHKIGLTEWFTSTQNTCPTLHWFIISDMAYKYYLRVGLVTCWWLHTSHVLYLQAHKDMMRASYGLTDRLTGVCGVCVCVYIGLCLIVSKVMSSVDHQ